MINENNLNECITSRERISVSDKTTIIRNMINNMITPVNHIITSISERSTVSHMSMVTSIFQSMRFDCDIYNIEFIDTNSLNYKILSKEYEKSGFYMISSSVVKDKKLDELVILFDLYKPKEVEPIAFMNTVFEKNPELMSFLYIKEMISLAHKNYRNKFNIANKARYILKTNNPNISNDRIDEISIALTQMAMDYHTNSIIIENCNTNNLIKAKSRTLENINNFRNSSFIAYNPNYSYKDKTQVDILGELVNDAIIDILNGNDGSSSTNNNTNQEGNDQNGTEDSERTYGENNGMGSDEQISSGDGDSNCGSPKHGDSDNSNSNISSDRDSPYESRQMGDQKNNGGSDEGEIIKVSFKSNKDTMLFMKLPPVKGNDRYESLDGASERDMNNLQDYVDRTTGKLRGSGINEIFESIGAPLEIDTNWTESILKSIDNKTNIIKSTASYCTWSKVNTYTKHICKLPGRMKRYMGTPVIYIMFDQSGSMSNNDIRKINYLIDHFYKKKYLVNVFIHDDANTIDDVKVYEFNPNKLINSDDISLDSLISSRIMSGGTSHTGVFDLMESYIRDVKNTDKKYSNHFCIICSDMYSNIEHIYQNYEWITLLGNNNIFNVTTHDSPVMPFGKMIYI